MLRALLRTLRTGALIVVLALLVAETALQAASFLARDRARPGRPDARYTVLCVGDSHTYGTGVEPEETYPSHLERLLDEQAPGRYAVVNVGIPGMNTGQVRERLPDLVRRYEPDLILVWVGINNSWNRAGEQREQSDLLVRLDRLAGHARTYRLARIWLHDRQLDRDRAAYAGGRTWEIVNIEHAFTGKDKFTVRRQDGVIETIQHDGDAEPSEGTEWQERTEHDYAAIVRYARAAGIPIAFVGYPLGDIGVGGVANRALRKVTAALDVPLVDSAASVARVPREEQNFLWAAHPDGRMYGEIARDILPVVLRHLPPHG
jgi:hypothetical protein